MPAWRNILRRHGGNKTIGLVNSELGEMILDDTAVVFLSRSGFYQGLPYYWALFGDSFGIAHHAYGAISNRAGESRYDSTLGDYPNTPLQSLALWPDARDAFANAVGAMTTARYRRNP